MHIFKQRSVLVLPFLVLVFIFSVTSVRATDYVVFNNADSGPGSFRQAVQNANDTGTVPDGVVFDPAFFSVPRTITLSSPIVIAGNGANEGLIVNIQGPGASLLTISGNNNTRLFSIQSGASPTISGMTITAGRGAGHGGAILTTHLNLTLNNIVFTNNNSTGHGGAIGNVSSGTMNITNCTFTGNNSISVNMALGEGGGAIFSDGALNISGSTIQNNTSQGGGGAIRIGNNFPSSITNTTISGNTAAGIGSFTGGGAILSTPPLTITGSQITNNTVNNDAPGGAINAQRGLTVSNSRISGNSAGGDGGAIAFYSGRPENLTINDSEISSNTANYDNNPSGTGDGNGGAIHSIPNTDVIINRSTISNNIARGTTTDQGNGGGLHIEGTLVMNNSTIAGNSAGNRGGGIDKLNSTANLTSNTIVNNTSDGQGGGILITSAIQFLLTNSIVANNLANGTAQDINGIVSLQGHNLVESTNATLIIVNGNGNIFDVDPMLGPLANNGGPTPTMVPQTGSRAIDGGRSYGLTTDQRGSARTRQTSAPDGYLGDGTDIGAVELFVQPTAASVSVSGRVLDANGRPVARATVQLTEADGNVQTAMTSPFGYYTFAGVGVGQSVILTVSSKQYQFPAQLITVYEEMTGFDLIAFATDPGKTGR